LVVVGLQEVEMGAGFLAISAAKETVRYLILPSVVCLFPFILWLNQSIISRCLQ
jgi:hypothetical protein